MKLSNYCFRLVRYGSMRGSIPIDEKSLADLWQILTSITIIIRLSLLLGLVL